MRYTTKHIAFFYALKLIELPYLCGMLEDKNQARTSLSELGEFGLINHLTKHFKIAHTSTVKAVGDDAAVLR